MQKVEVHRYVSGRRPDYAPMSSSVEDPEDELTEQKQRSFLVDLCHYGTRCGSSRRGGLG
jgi:hypothetical protein